jgi:hypothetical protein
VYLVSIISCCLSYVVGWAVGMNFLGGDYVCLDRLSICLARGSSPLGKPAHG